MNQPRKKLIEVSMPLEAINAASKRTKTKAPKGYPTSFHKYWAHRPLAACRAVIFGQLVDDPSAWPERFETTEAQDAERERLHRIIREFVEWPTSTPADQARWEAALEAGRREIARSLAWGRGDEPPTERRSVLEYLAEFAPPLHDPFCGGGSIPLEAQRLGLRASGSDLNPIPVLISKALVEIPPIFAGLSPVSTPDTTALMDRPWRGAEGLAQDVRHYGAWMRMRAQELVGHLYPDAVLRDGRKATVVAWLWARTVRSPDPAAKGAMVPLASSFLLSSKAGRETIVRVVRDAMNPQGWRFEVQQGGVSNTDLASARAGTQSARGANFTCALTGAPIDGDWIKSEGAAGRMGARLMAVIAEGDRTRQYLTPTEDHEAAAASARPDWRPTTALPNDPRNFWTIPYGLTTFGDLFTDRQLVGLATFSDLIKETRDRVVNDAKAAFDERGVVAKPGRLSEGGTGPEAYADAIATYLAFAVDRMAEYGCSGASWLPKDSAVRSALARQAIPMVWDYCEANYFAKSSAGAETCIAVVADAIDKTPAISSGTINQWAAQNNSFSQDCVFSTDPPYYDNIAYADLYDFFYVWLKKSLSDVWPALFRRIETPKEEELVAAPYRHGGKDAAEAHFMGGMRQALAAMARASDQQAPLVIYYAFKQSEKSEDGVSSAGWASFLEAMIQSGLMIDGTWPMRTESEERLIGNKANMLASSIVLVCRPRPQISKTTTRRDFVAELRRELPEALGRMRAAGVHPVDLPQSALGPGMAVFSKYSVVREPDDSPMGVGRAIKLINQVRGEIAHADSGDLDAATRFALDWFEAYGWEAKSAGEAIKLAQSYDLTERGLRDAGVLAADRGDARLVRRAEMPRDWRPSRDRTHTTWELAQALNRALNDGGGIGDAAVLLAEARELATAARWLTERLFGLAEDRRMTDEARGWGRLSEAWDAIDAEAGRTAGPIVPRTQADLF